MKQENIEDIYELSSMQHGMLFHTIAAPSSGVYFQQFCCTLHQLDVSAFKKAWQRVVDRHSILRTSFYWKGLDKPYQVVYQQVDLPWELLDWRKLSLQEQQKQQESFLKADRERGFELSFAPLMRIALIRVTDDAYLLIHSHHHIILDGLSWNLLWKEFYSFYDAFCQGDNLHLERLPPYRDYIAWLQQQDLSKSEVFWRQMLKGFTLPTPLGIDKTSGSFKSQDEEYERQHTHLSANITAALKSLARQHQLTLNILFKGAWALLLSRYNNEEDIVFGVTSFGRPVALEGVESMVGLFINTLPLRVQVHSNAFLLPWLKQIQSQEVEMRQYEYSPLIQIQQWSEIAPGLSLFESFLIFNNHLVDSAERKLAENMRISKYRSFEKTNYPLTIAVTPDADLLEMSIAITYDTRRFDSATITRMLGHLETLLQAMVANPERLLRDLPLLTAQESYQLLVWNDTQEEYPQEKCIHQLFEAQVELTPEAIAVVFENSVLTYCELNARANQLAHHLRSRGVKPEVLVGICVERSLDMVIGLLGILKAGGAYVPFDPAYPRERLALMLSDSQVSVLLTQQQLVDKLPDHKAHVVCLDKDWESISHTSQENLASSVTVANLAYIIYTSGSTGKPKGIGLCQSSLMNLLQWHFSSLYKGARTLQFASLSFDASFHEIFATWGTGGTLFILSENLRMDPLGLGRFLLEQAIEKVIFPVVMLQQLAESVDEHGTTPQYTKIFSSLREIITTGEQLQITQSIIRLFKSLKHCSLHNHYGPSETHVVTAFNLKKNADEWSFYPPIGKPIANTQIYILDQQFNPVPIGVTGELYIGGVSLAQGYLNRPDLTAEKFIPNPFSDQLGTRLYKTGDLTCYLPNGNIKYIKRIDHQIKIRGFRIELGEIEVVLSQHRAIEQVVVLAQKDEAGNTRLVAYVVLNHESTPTTSELRSFLHPKLPSYMIPSAFVFLKELPLTPNGKVNRQALPIPDKAQLELERIFVAPRTVAQEMVAEIWKQVLGIEKVGIHDNFFELGGHSLMTTQVTSRINQALQMELPIRSLFESPTIESLINEIARIWGSLEVVEEIARTWKELEQISVNEVKML